MNAAPQLDLAMGDDFLVSYGSLPKQLQKRTSEFLRAFPKDPKAPTFNYEKIKNSADPKMRSARINQEYRAIILQPEKGNTYIVLWVDKHDDAYTWACRKRCIVNATTGVLQVIPVVLGEPEVIAATHAKPIQEKPTGPGKFDPFTNQELLEVGVPDECLPMTRSVVSDEDLERIEPKLPKDAFEALFYLASNYTLEETQRELGLVIPETPVDPSDLETALQKPATQRNFRLITDDAALTEALAFPLDRWRIFPHPSQKRVIEINANGPVRVLGGAGTGKTVVAMHRAHRMARDLVQEFPGGHERILFTTFSKTLAKDIEANLRKLCHQDELDRIEVINLDAWVSRFLQAQSAGKRMAYFGYEGELRNLWEKALGSKLPDCPLNDDQVRREWEHVIQAQAILTEIDYITCPRRGMGTRLSRSQRKLLWPVFEEYRALLTEAGLLELQDAMRSARKLLEARPNLVAYKGVIVDEGQDFSPEAYRLISQLTPSRPDGAGQQIFIVGDPHQRIYAHNVVLSHCGIDIRGRGRRLNINYRTPEETRRWAVGILEGLPIDDMDGNENNTHQAYRSAFHGSPPVELDTSTDTLIDHIKSLIAGGAEEQAICLTARTKTQLQSYEKELKVAGISIHHLGNQSIDNHSTEGVRLATMHRVKGLEFDHMILTHLDYQRWASEPASNDRALQERCLIHVAATRCRRSLAIVG